tara:strand:- start:3289 stop:4503 length:1215 start_codon:yes stop_codon:yes gene_type:complete
MRTDTQSAIARVFPEIDFATDPLPDFHQRMAALRDAGRRVVPVNYLGATAWIILRHEDVSALYRNESGVPAAPAYRRHSEPAQGKTLLCMEGDEHRVNRLLVSGAFHPGAIRRRIDTLLRPLADELIDSLAGSSGVDLVSAYTHRYPFKVITGLLGIPVEDEPELHQWLDGLFQFPWNPSLALEARAAITAYLAPIVQQRRAQPQDDLLSLLAAAEVEGKRLTDEEIFSFVRLIFPAGADTTYLSLGSLLWAVLRDDALRETLLADAALHAAAVDEGLRLYGAVCLQPRYTERQINVAGVTIPANSALLYGNATANRDPAVFTDADTFRLDRGAHHKSVTFGGGPHFCLGSHLARAEIEVSLGALLGRLPGLRLADPAQPGPQGAVLRGVRELPVLFDAVLPAA